MRFLLWQTMPVALCVQIWNFERRPRRQNGTAFMHISIAKPPLPPRRGSTGQTHPIVNACAPSSAPSTSASRPPRLNTMQPSRAVRWLVFEGVDGEGILLEPEGVPKTAHHRDSRCRSAAREMSQAMGRSCRRRMPGTDPRTDRSRRYVLRNPRHWHDEPTASRVDLTAWPLRLGATSSDMRSRKFSRSVEQFRFRLAARIERSEPDDQHFGRCDAHHRRPEPTISRVVKVHLTRSARGVCNRADLASTQREALKSSPCLTRSHLANLH
jgi:hypothetical protein